MFNLSHATKTLTEVEYHIKIQFAVWDERRDDPLNHYSGYVGKVRVVEVTRSPKHSLIRFFYRLV